MNYDNKSQWRPDITQAETEVSGPKNDNRDYASSLNPFKTTWNIVWLTMVEWQQLLLHSLHSSVMRHTQYRGYLNYNSPDVCM